MAPLARTCAMVVFVAGVAGALSCAFISQGCHPDVCAKMQVAKFDDLLNGVSQLLGPEQEFDPRDTTRRGDWAKYADTLGYFYGIKNPKANPGNKALDGKAPSLNFLRFRQSFGILADDGVSLAECCNLCRVKPDCIIYQFNPNIASLEDDDGNVIGQTFDGDNGECWYIFSKNKAAVVDVQGACASGTTNFYDEKVKPTFFGGHCNVSVADDPHFVGARGTRYDFNGQLDKSFCLLADQKLQLNTVLRGYQDAAGGETGLRSWMKEMGLVWADAQGQKHTLQLVARQGKEQRRGNGFLSKVVLDGAEVPVPGQPGDILSESDMSLSFQGTKKVGPYEVDQFQVTVGDVLDLGLSMRVAHPKLQTPEDAEVHFNMMLNSIAASDKIHGVLGQTYRNTQAQAMKAIKYSILSRILGAPVQADGQTGKGFLEGEISDYVTSSVTAADCKFSSL